MSTSNADTQPEKEPIFKAFVDCYGQPANQSRSNIDELMISDRSLPHSIIDFWACYGFGSYADGLIWTHPPVIFDDVIEEWTGLQSHEASFIFRTSLGDFCFWSKNAVYLLDTQYGRVDHIAESIKFLFNYILCRERFLSDVLNSDMHHQCVQRLGHLTQHECYGFVPVKALGGSGEAETAQKVAMREYLVLLSQLGGAVSVS